MTATRGVQKRAQRIRRLPPPALGGFEDQRKGMAMCFGCILARNCTAFTQNLPPKSDSSGRANRCGALRLGHGNRESFLRVEAGLEFGDAFFVGLAEAVDPPLVNGTRFVPLLEPGALVCN